MIANLLAPLLAAAPITIDSTNHFIEFEVVSADPGMAAPVEFLIAGPESDHDYESMFLTVASVGELAAAFDKAGIPRGQGIDYKACRFWPIGEELAFEPDLWSFLKDTRDERKAQVVFTGGNRTPDGIPEAHTNMPQAVFALYDCSQSLLQFNDSLPQSITYGRFVPAMKIPRGEKRTIKVTWKGTRPSTHLDLRLEPGKQKDAIALLQEKSAEGELDVLPDFSPDLTIAEAEEIASALQVIDSARVKINGFKDGQFFYRAFLPLEKWRDRTERLTQPYELRISDSTKPVLTVVKEDWSSDPDAMEPKLTVIENADFASIGGEGDMTDTCLIFAPKTTKLASVFAVRQLLPKRVSNFYVYGD